VRAVLIAPLLAGVEPVGAITLTKPIPDYFTEYQERVVSTLAAQAAVVVRNAQLYETSQRTLAHFEALKAISERINSQQDIQAAFDLIATSAHEVLGADRCALYLGEAGEEITHTFTRGLPPEHLQGAVARLKDGVGLLSVAMRQKEPVIAVDALVDPRASHEMAQTAGYRTIASFPLKYRETNIGVLALYHNEVHPYGVSDTALGMAFANQAAIAVQNTRLLEEAGHRAHQMGLLNRIFTRVATSLSPRDLFDALVEELHTTLGYPLVTIRRIDGGQLRDVAHRGYAGIQETSPISVGIIGRVARTGQAAFVTDITRDPDYIAWDPRVTQEACVPIAHQGRVVGVICVEVFEPNLTLDDLNLLNTLAGYAAVALEKAQLYEQTQALATTDGLTGLLNYRAFWQAMERELERSMRYGLPLALIMIEIDKFKRFNDAYGHLRGDEVIRMIARVLQQEHRAQIDIVARYGGDEFMILLPHTQKVTAAEVAERIRRAAEATPLISAVELASVTLSLGVACYPEDGKSPDALVEAVDRSMYRAKQQGGNAVAVANTS
jgi:diguanylate cyclase (GGDEF)-like protein